MEKIIVTVGPSSLSEDVIKKMDAAGVDIFRINMSHTRLDDFKKYAEMLAGWTSKAICLDTEGAQLRTGELPGDGVLQLKPYEHIEFVSNGGQLKAGQIPLNVRPADVLREGALLKIDFDAAIIQVTSIAGEKVQGRVIFGGRIGTNKGIGVDEEIELPPFSQKDLQAFKAASQLGIRHVALSFASTGEDVKRLREFFDYKIEVISKIESRTALKNLDSICAESDAVLIDRGDLSRDVPLEKMVFAQQHIMERARAMKRPVFVATNLMENMISQSKPTRAEVHDIVASIRSGIDGLVLAAETAVGRYPVECVRIMSRIMKEVRAAGTSIDPDYLTTIPNERMIEPHGGVLVQQHLHNVDMADLNNMPVFKAGEDLLTDVVNIGEGVYSPVTEFMGDGDLNEILHHNRLASGVSWTLPILMQVNEETARSLPHTGEVLLQHGVTGENYAVLKIRSVKKNEDMKKTARTLFGTDEESHPGVAKFLHAGDYLVNGEPRLLRRKNQLENNSVIMLPRQTRDVINDAGWHNIVGFHTRNIPHLGHEYIQKEALARTNADALFISPVIGSKKSGDFKGYAIIRCYEQMISDDVYSPYEVMLNAFNTYSRYCGPREAVFTALCRKNFGCNYFIVGRDHTGVGQFYGPDSSIQIFDNVDTGINIVAFDKADFCMECGRVVESCIHGSEEKRAVSGTQIRESLIEGREIPWYMMRSRVADCLRDLYRTDASRVIE